MPGGRRSGGDPRRRPNRRRGRGRAARRGQAHATGFIAPDNYLPALTFQVWTMLILGGAGNAVGAVIGAVIVWTLWSASGAAIGALVPANLQARAAALQLTAIGVTLAAMLLLRPRGMVGARVMVSRFAKRRPTPRAGSSP